MNTYNFIHFICIDYLLNTYIKHHRRRFTTCYINQILHFDIIVTFRDEKKHAMLKKQLKNSIDNFKKIINDINFLLINQIHKHSQKIIKTQLRYFIEFRLSVFQDLTIHVISYILRLIVFQYQLMINQFTILSRCIEIFFTNFKFFLQLQNSKTIISK